MGKKNSRTDSMRKALQAGEMDISEMQVVLDLYRDLFPVATKSLKPALQLRMPGGEEAKMRLQEGFHLLDLPSLAPSGRSLTRRADEILKVLSRHTADRQADSTTYARLREAGVLEDLVSVYLTEGEESLRAKFSGAGDLNPEVAMFTTFNCLKGVFLGVALALESIDTSQWEHQGCPVCGGAPAVAFLTGEGGQRHLVCHRCETRWRSARIQCPYCFSTDHKTLGYFTIEGDDPHIRVDFCRKCSRYIKTWDLREKEQVLAEVEDLRTARYDRYAETEGFHRGGPNIFGVWIGLEEGAGAQG